MDIEIVDIFVTATDAGLILQGASQAAITLLRSLGSLVSGTAFLLPSEGSDEVFKIIDAAGLRTMTLG